MILLSGTCSKAQLAQIFALFILLTGQQLVAITVTGQVKLTNSKDSKEKKGNSSGVVVWLQPTDGEVLRVSGKHAEMLQKDKRFTPHILAVTTGTIVDFPNEDPIFHNAFSNFDGKIFDIGLYAPGSSKSVRFDRPGIVRVFCNIHPSMSAIIVVLNSSYFGETEDDGSFSIHDVPAGNYVLHFFYERATSETLEKLTRRISLARPSTVLRPVTISETGYLPVPHKNKFGRDYPPQSEEQEDYSLPLK